MKGLSLAKICLRPEGASLNCPLVSISLPDVFLEESVLKICSKFTGEHPCRSAISIKLQCNIIEIALWQGCFPVNLLHILRTPTPENTFSFGKFFGINSDRVQCQQRCRSRALNLTKIKQY